jgi:hypothetical protein
VQVTHDEPKRQAPWHRSHDAKRVKKRDASSTDPPSPEVDDQAVGQAAKVAKGWLNKDKVAQGKAAKVLDS